MIKKFLLIGLLFIILLGSCTSTTPVFYSNNTNYDFIILGIVTYQGEGRTGFQDLMQVAKRQYPDADYIIDIMIDRKVTSFLFINTESSSYTMRATAIQYIRRDINGEIIKTPTPTQAPRSVLGGLLPTQSATPSNEVVFSSNYIGTWKRDNFDNILTITSNSLKSSSSPVSANLISISNDLFTFIYSSSNRTFSYTIKFIDDNIEISGGTSSGQGNWNGIWKRQ